MMTGDNLRFALTLLAALGCGLMAGVFFAFSTFVMRALARLPRREGIAAMQSINVAVINPLFMTAFLGTAALCALVIIASLVGWTDAGAIPPLSGQAWRIAGGALYLAGNIVVTGMANVPRNNALAAVSPDDPGSARLWADYLSSWMAWNHVRTATALAAAAAFIIALRF
jgi:uncharacterized membrane protein